MKEEDEVAERDAGHRDSEAGEAGVFENRIFGSLRTLTHSLNS